MALKTNQTIPRTADGEVPTGSVLTFDFTMNNRIKLDGKTKIPQVIAFFYPRLYVDKTEAEKVDRVEIPRNNIPALPESLSKELTLAEIVAINNPSGGAGQETTSAVLDGIFKGLVDAKLGHTNTEVITLLT